MISKDERQHILKIKQWSEDSREGMRKLEKGPAGKLLQKIKGESNPDVIFDNIDWLIALIERESHTAGMKTLMNAVETEVRR